MVNNIPSSNQPIYSSESMRSRVSDFGDKLKEIRNNKGLDEDKAKQIQDRLQPLKDELQGMSSAEDRIKLVEEKYASDREQIPYDMGSRAYRDDLAKLNDEYNALREDLKIM